MADLPANVSYGVLTGHLVRAVMDTTSDVNVLPDSIPARGRIILTPKLSPGFAKDASALLTIVPDPYIITLDVNGFIVDAAGSPGVTLLATDDPDLQPVNWTWQMSFDLEGVSIPSFTFSMPSGQTIDLSTIVPTAASSGTSLSVAEAAAAAAATSAAAAAASAAQGGGGGGFTPEQINDFIINAVRGTGLIVATPSDINDIVTISTTATANSTDAVLLNRANHTGTQLSTSISDFIEAVQDAAAAMLNAGGSGSYDDVTNAYSVVGGTGGGVTLEQVRDMLATALVGGMNMVITPNDVADTITVALAQQVTFLQDPTRTGQIIMEAVNDPNGSAARNQIFKAMGPLSRGGPVWYDEFDRLQVWVGWHDKLPDGGVHHGFEVKTSTDPGGSFPNVMATRFRITSDGNQGAAGSDLAVASFFSVSNVVIENGKSTPGVPFGLVFNTPRVGDVVAATATQGNWRPLKITTDVDASGNAIAYIAVGIVNGTNIPLSAKLQMFRETNVTGVVEQNFFKGDNTNSLMAKIDSKAGQFYGMGLDGVTLKKAVLDDDTRLAPTKVTVGLGNVDNVSDINKPVSTAVTNKLVSKAEVVRWVTGTGWGTYSTSANDTRFFISTNDVNATAPTYYSAYDQWFAHKDAA